MCPHPPSPSLPAPPSSPSALSPAACSRTRLAAPPTRAPSSAPRPPLSPARSLARGDSSRQQTGRQKVLPTVVWALEEVLVLLVACLPPSPPQLLHLAAAPLDGPSPLCLLPPVMCGGGTGLPLPLPPPPHFSLRTRSLPHTPRWQRLQERRRLPMEPREGLRFAASGRQTAMRQPPSAAVCSP